MRCTFTPFTVISSISLHYTLTFYKQCLWSLVKHPLLMSCQRHILRYIQYSLKGNKEYWQNLYYTYNLRVKGPVLCLLICQLTQINRSLFTLNSFTWWYVNGTVKSPLTFAEKTAQGIPVMFTGTTLTSLLPPAPQLRCSCPGERCHTCHRPAASEWCSGSLSTESPAFPSSRSLDSPTVGHCKHSNIPPLTEQLYPAGFHSKNRNQTTQGPILYLSLWKLMESGCLFGEGEWKSDTVSILPVSTILC